MTHIRAPRGTIDVFPEKPGIWQRLEETVRSVCRNAGYTEIRTPIFEHTELFQRGVGKAQILWKKKCTHFLTRESAALRCVLKAQLRLSEPTLNIKCGPGLSLSRFTI